MTAQFINEADVVRRCVGYPRHDGGPFEHHLNLARPLADWDVWDFWERDRVQSVRRYLQSRTVLYDVGAEHGRCSRVYPRLWVLSTWCAGSALRMCTGSPKHVNGVTGYLDGSLT